MWPPPSPTGGRKRGGGNWKSYFFPARICPLINPKGVITEGRIINTILCHNISCSIYMYGTMWFQDSIGTLVRAGYRVAIPNTL